MPVNPQSGKAVLLTPREYLRSLPTLNAEDFWEGYGNAENEMLRANVNHDISSKVKKADIVKFARENPDKLIQYARDKEAAGSDPYDFDRDEAGLVSWHAPTQVFCQAIHPRRNWDTLTMLLGGRVRGVLVSDRSAVYDDWTEKDHQVCWAYLKRNWEAQAERNAAA